MPARTSARSKSDHVPKAENPLQELRRLSDPAGLETSVVLGAIRRSLAQNPELTAYIHSDYQRSVKEYSARVQTAAGRASRYLQAATAHSRQRTADFLKSPARGSHLPGQIPLDMPQDRQLPIFPASPSITLAAYACVLEPVEYIPPADFLIKDGGLTPQGCGAGGAQQVSPELIKFFLEVQSEAGASNSCELLIRRGAHLATNQILNDPNLHVAEHDTLFFETGAIAMLHGRVAGDGLGLFDTGGPAGGNPGTLNPQPAIQVKAELIFSLWDATRSNRPPLLLGSDSLVFHGETITNLLEHPYVASGSANLKVSTVVRRSRTLAITIDLKLALTLTGDAGISLDQQFSSFYLQPFYFSRQACKYTFVKIRTPWEIELEGGLG
jgi:hypothetical protein